MPKLAFVYKLKKYVKYEENPERALKSGMAST
jgi:hypothetical protein